MVGVTIGCFWGGSVASCVVRGGRASSAVPVCGQVDPGLTVCCSVDGWLVVVGSVVVLVGSVCWVSGLGVVCCVCWGCCSLGLRLAGHQRAQAGSLGNSMLALAGGNVRATFSKESHIPPIAPTTAL